MMTNGMAPSTSNGKFTPRQTRLRPTCKPGASNGEQATATREARRRRQHQSPQHGDTAARQPRVVDRVHVLVSQMQRQRPRLRLGVANKLCQPDWQQRGNHPLHSSARSCTSPRSQGNAGVAVASQATDLASSNAKANRTVDSPAGALIVSNMCRLSIGVVGPNRPAVREESGPARHTQSVCLSPGLSQTRRFCSCFS